VFDRNRGVEEGTVFEKDFSGDFSRYSTSLSM
jgi:hypothetical protein